MKGDKKESVQDWVSEGRALICVRVDQRGKKVETTIFYQKTALPGISLAYARLSVRSSQAPCYNCQYKKKTDI